MQYKIKRSRSLVVGAGLLALAGAAHAAPPSNEELQKQIKLLQQTVEALKKQVGGEVAAEKPAAKPAEAGESTPEYASKEEIEGLRADLENYKYQQQRNRDTATVLAARNTTISGTIQTRFTASQPGVTGGSTTPAQARNSGFSIPVALLAFNGSLYKDYKEGRNLDYRLQFGYAPGNPANANAQFNLQDAYLRYSPLPTGGDLETPILNLTLGQQLLPFGLEVQTDESLRPTINQAQFAAGTGLTFRQIGLIARGDLAPTVDYSSSYRAPLFEYNLGVVNGSGPNVQDNNNNKAVIARVASTLPVDYASWLRELKIGASYYNGGLSLQNGSVAVNPKSYDHFYGFDIYYNHLPFGATFEYVKAENKDNIGGGASKGARGVSKTLTAFYTWGEQFLASSKSQAKYDDWWPKSYQVFGRWDQWNPDTRLPNTTNGKSTISTLGLNVFFAQTTKFQLNYNHTDYALPGKKDQNEILAQFQFGF